MSADAIKLNELVGGMAAGLVQDGLLHPLDTMRARLDVGVVSDPQRLAALRAQGPGAALLSEARSVLAADGLRGIYRGYGFCLATSAPCNAAYFGAYSTVRRQISDGSPLHDAACGLVAEATASILWTPVDVVKQRLQVGAPGLKTSEVVRAACSASGGITGLWRGYLAGLATWGPCAHAAGTHRSRRLLSSPY